VKRQRAGKDVSSQLLGTGGTYYVMAQLALRGFQASCTFGNAPYVDVLVSAPDGHRTVTIQVKTARYATRFRGRGDDKVPYELQWPVGYKAATTSFPTLFFALVDLWGLEPDTVPDVYIVPSRFVKSFCAAWVDKVPWVRIHVPYKRMRRFKNNWQLLQDALK